LVIFRWRIYREILNAQELFTISPQAFKAPTIVRNITLIVYLLVCLSLFYIVIVLDYTQDKAIAMVLLISILSILFVPIILISNKTYPLVFTTKGIVMFPYIAEDWPDIIGYGWQTYADFSGLPLQTHKEKKVLFIVNKGSLFRQRNLAKFSLSILGHHHVYPSEQQLSEIENIFLDHAINRFDTPVDAIDSQN
jgi:hypothetical protein